MRCIMRAALPQADELACVQEMMAALEEVYGDDIEACDLLVGNLAEKKIPGFAISETSFFIFIVRTLILQFLGLFRFRLSSVCGSCASQTGAPSGAMHALCHVHRVPDPVQSTVRSVRLDRESAVDLSANRHVSTDHAA